MIEWIDANKKFPDINEAFVGDEECDEPFAQCITKPVLVFIPGHGEESGIHVARLWIYTDGKKGEAIWMAESRVGHEYEGVTHWANLPEPPKGDGVCSSAV